MQFYDLPTTVHVVRMVYVAGGWDGSTRVAALHCYDPVTDTSVAMVHG